MTWTCVSVSLLTSRHCLRKYVLKKSCFEPGLRTLLSTSERVTTDRPGRWYRFSPGPVFFPGKHQVPVVFLTQFDLNYDLKLTIETGITEVRITSSIGIEHFLGTV